MKCIIAKPAGPTWKEIVCPYASCNDCCIMHYIGVHADPELAGGGCGCSCMLLLHPAPTCADAGPDLCTLHPDLWHKHATCACGGFTHCKLHWWYFLFSHWHRYSTCTHGGSTLCNLRWWRLSLQPLAQILYLHTSNLHCVVVVVCGGGSCSYE